MASRALILAALAAAGLPAMARAQGFGPEPAQAVPPPAAEPAVVSDPLVQRGVPAEASAENAVVARERALAAGQRIAYERMAEAVGLQRNASDSQIESMVASIVIEQERVTPTRYAARVTVNFNASRVRSAAAAAGGGAAAAAASPSVAAAAPVLPFRPATAPAAMVEALARYGSVSEWAELRQRLAGSGAVAAMEVVAISTDRARLRLALREAPGTAASALAAAGLSFAPPPPVNGASLASLPPDQARLAQAWRLSLAGRF
jgi:hypothetical protein